VLLNDIFTVLTHTLKKLSTWIQAVGDLAPVLYEVVSTRR